MLNLFSIIVAERSSISAYLPGFYHVEIDMGSEESTDAQTRNATMAKRPKHAGATR